MALTPDEVLRACWDGRLPVDPFRIAQALGLVVVPEAVLADGICGRIEYRCATPMISFSLAAPALRQRFAVAHATGHFALGHMEGGVRRFCDPVANFSTDVHQPEEEAANQFASGLLMPGRLLAYVIQEKGITDVQKLAELFKVSQVAMEYRLRRLRLIA